LRPGNGLAFVRSLLPITLFHHLEFFSSSAPPGLPSTVSDNVPMTIVPSSPNNQDRKAAATPKETARAKSPDTPPIRSTILSARESVADHSTETALRPHNLAEYVGQTRLKAIFQMSIAAAKGRGEPLDHVLLYGPPGLGKTTLAKVLAHEMEARIHMTSGPSLERPRDILGLVHQLQPGDVLFVDEIHRLSRVAEELLYPAMEDFAIDLTAGKGQTTRSMRLALPKFTLIGATTKAGMIANALRDRFGFVSRLDFYSIDELEKIVTRTAGILKLTLNPEAVLVIASRARGTPRIANRLVRMARDYAQYVGKDKLDKETTLAGMQTYQIDAYGLDATDRRLLEIMIENYGGGPVGVDTLSATIGEDSDTLESVYEPFLIQAGFIQRTNRGRVCTHKAYDHLGYERVKGQLALDLLVEKESDN
jgi:holliday junction DNA helicase RuvB